MANVAPSIGDMYYRPVAPMKQESAEDILARQEGLLNPRLDNALKQYGQSMSSAMQERAIDPSVMGEWIRSGGLERASGSTVGQNLFGLTPDEMAPILNRQQNPVDVLMKHQQAADVLTGAKDRRAMIQDVAGKNLAARTTSAMQLVPNAFKEEGDTEFKNKQLETQNESGRVNATANVRQQLETERRNKVLESEQVYIRKKLEEQMRLNGGVSGIPESTPMSQTLHQQMVDIAGKGWDSKKKQFDFDKVPDENWNSFADKFMRKEALGLPIGSTRYPKGKFKTAAGNYGEVMLTPSGWVGIVRDPKTNKIIGGSPVWDLFVTPKGKSSSSGDTEVTGMDKFSAR